MDDQVEDIIIADMNSNEDCKFRGPLSIAMGEVEKITEILQGNLERSCDSSGELIEDHDDWVSSREGNKVQDELLSCLMVMKKLMEEAETENTRLKEDKKLLTRRISESLSSVNKEMDSLRLQLKQQDRRLNDLSPHHNKRDSPKEHKTDDNSIIEQNNGRDKIQNGIVNEEKKLESSIIVERLSTEKKLLIEEVERLRDEASSCANCGDLRDTIQQLQVDLKKSKDGHLIARKERKQLKTDKLELLNQMKQLYNTIEDKERELRDFILNYEQRMKDGEEAIRELVSEKEKVQKDRWEILKHAKENAERCVNLKTKVDGLQNELNVKEQQLQSAVREIERLSNLQKTNLTSDQTAINDADDEDFQITPSKLSSTPIHISGDDDSTTTSKCDSNRISVSSETSTNGGVSGDSPSPSPGFHTQYLSLGYPEAFDLGKVASRRHSVSGAERRPRSYLAAQMSYHNVTPSCSTVDTTDAFTPGRGRRSLSETLSRIFNRDKERESMDQSPKSIPGDIEEWNGLDEDSGKWETWDSMQNVPMGHWSARAVLVWLEIECCMGAYAQKCAENIRNGRMLLDLSQQQLVSVLGITNPIHKMKLKLAIDEYRTSNKRKSHVSKLDHMWVSGTWLRDLGLTQYSSIFESNLVDGRVLNAITKKDLEKYFNMTKKFHQTSFFCGVELLRNLHFNKEVLYMRRSNCLDSNFDVLVWSNERIAKWLESHDLKEYSSRMPESGIHGALMVFEKSFTAESLTNAIGMQMNKQLATKLAGTELTLLLKTERSRIGPTVLSRHSKSKKSSLTRSLSWRFSRRNSEEQLNKPKNSGETLSLSLPRPLKSEEKDTPKSASNGKMTAI